MIIQPFIKKAIVKNIIAPHGITDIMHSVHQNTTKDLLIINSISCSSCLLFDNNFIYNNGINIFFLLMSIVHFRHDMPYILNIPKYVISSLLLLSVYYNHDIFYIYMVIIHVPRHYITNYYYIKKNFLLNIIILLFTTYTINVLDNIILLSPMLINIIKNIVISHIIYQEKFIHN